MSEATGWLIEAIERKQLIEFSDMGYWRTCEPHVYAQGPGGREILIAFQIDVGHGSAPNEQLWKLVDASRARLVEPARLFSKTRPIPTQYAQQVRKVYAQVSDASHTRKGKAPN